jgi:enoyl-[acyl-carrier protein] reductase II
MRTRLTEMLGVEHPVMLAGMGGVSYHLLAAAVSKAGGFGCLGASTMSSAQMVEEIAATRALTDRPFGVDLLTAMPEEMVDNVEKIIAGGAQVFVAGLGVPLEVIELCHRNNVLVVNMCGRVRHAVAAVEAGCDIVVAQGTEAGGHTGVGGRVPVVAAGGIYDGRGLAAALALGADGVWVGTRFIATPEARAVAGYKDTLLRTAEDGTVVTRGYSGKTMRAIRNQYTREVEEHPEAVQPFPAQLFAAGVAGVFHLGGDADTPGVDPDRECYPAGQAVGGIDALVPAGELVHRFVAEAESAIARMAAIAAGAPA